jgi:serine protease Do
MDKFNRLSGTMKATCIVALALVMTGALVLLAADNAAAEKSERGFLGVSIQRLDDSGREKLGVSHGVQVVAVEKESGAAKAGMQKEDVIQSVNGEKVRDPQSLTEIIRDLAPGSTAKIGLWRNGKAQEVKVVLGKLERPKRFSWHGQLPRVFRSRGYLGISLQELNDDLAAYFGVKAGAGVLITEVVKDTPAAKAGLKAGDVLVQMGEKPVKDSEDIHEILAGLKKGDSIAITVIRHGKREALKAEPDFSRRERVIRMFSGDDGKDILIDPLELPEMDFHIPEIDVAIPQVPDVPEPPDCEEILHKVHEKMDMARIKIDERLKHRSEDHWI